MWEPANKRGIEAMVRTVPIVSKTGWPVIARTINIQRPRSGARSPEINRQIAANVKLRSREVTTCFERLRAAGLNDVAVTAIPSSLARLA
jgi:hypothetical protein